MTTTTSEVSADIRHRVDDLDWDALATQIDATGHAITPPLLSPGEDFDGGQFVLLEQRPRAQSHAHVLTPLRGAFVIFPTRERPNRGTNAYHRVGLRHGVSTVTRDQRTALGIIFHDAK